MPLKNLRGAGRRRPLNLRGSVGRSPPGFRRPLSWRRLYASIPRISEPPLFVVAFFLLGFRIDVGGAQLHRGSFDMVVHRFRHAVLHTWYLQEIEQSASKLSGNLRGRVLGT